METPVYWHAARQARQRKNVKRSADNIFAGAHQFESASFDGIELIRLSVWPGGTTAAPISYAVVADNSNTSLEDQFETADHHSLEFEIDLGDRRSCHQLEDESQENPDDFKSKAIAWEDREACKLPFNLAWQQTSESRWEISFDLPFDARCSGLGERRAGSNLRSHVHTLFNTDTNPQLESTDSMYVSIPFLIIEHRARYHGLFLDSPARQRWDLDSQLDGKACIELLSRRGWQLYYLGPSSLQKIVCAYTKLTGRARMPPLWAVGYQQSRWSYPDEETVIRLAHEFRSRSIPCDSITLDIDYMDDYRVFTYSNARFPHFKEMISDLSKNAFKIITIVDPGVKRDNRYFVYGDGKKHGFFCQRSNGRLFTANVWPGSAVFPDFCREDVRLWWAAWHGFFTELGVHGVWNDMNEPSLFGAQEPLAVDAEELPPDSKQLFMQTTPDGTVGHFEVRNLYGLLMSRATHEGLTALRPNERPFILSRSGYAGIQRYAAVWLGDNTSWWADLKQSIPMLINLGLSGVAFCGADVGGFAGDCSPELLVRWYALGMFYPFFRNHCSMLGSTQEPWVFSPQVEEHCRRFIQLRYRLMPYIYRLFSEHHRTGAPLIRPLSWHYPEDDFASEIDDEFMFGEDILVAPIVERAHKSRAVYLPEGTWHKFDTGEVLEGGRLHQIVFELVEVPAFVRDGAVIPFASAVQNTAELAEAEITFVCFGASGRGFYYEDDGTSFDYQDGNYNEWRIKVDGGKFVSQPVELGYESPPRQFYLLYDGVKMPVEFSP